MQNLVTMQNNQPTTTSLIIAEVFNKRQDNVIRDIEALLTDMRASTETLNHLKTEAVAETNTSVSP